MIRDADVRASAPRAVRGRRVSVATALTSVLGAVWFLSWAPSAPAGPEPTAAPHTATGAWSAAQRLHMDKPYTPVVAAAEERPALLRIPSIQVATELVPLGLNEDGTVEVPTQAHQAGWYELGPMPGQVGSAVVLGHVDSREGPAVFHRLSQLLPGDRVEVQSSEGVVVAFEVIRVATFANQDFPARQVYAGSPGRVTLNLVTCGGEYDASRGGYQANVVVFTEVVAADRRARVGPAVGDPERVR